MQFITSTHISCKYIYLHIHFLEYNNLAHSDKGHRSFCIIFTHTETPSHWKHTALYSMTLLQFSTFPVPIHIPRCWTKSILKTSASYQTYNSHTISQNRFRRNFKWKNHFYTQPSYVCGYNLARNRSCEYSSVISFLTTVIIWRGEKSGSGVSSSVKCSSGSLLSSQSQTLLA